MELRGLSGSSFEDGGAVAACWAKGPAASRLLLFAARRYLDSDPVERADRADLIRSATLPAEVKAAFAAPPNPKNPASRSWGEFVDAALATELEMIPYGERPVLLGELRAGLAKAAEKAGPDTPLSRWFLARRDALPGRDLPENPEYLPV